LEAANQTIADHEATITDGIAFIEGLNQDITDRDG
jgi:hypothetical protein